MREYLLNLTLSKRGCQNKKRADYIRIRLHCVKFFVKSKRTDLWLVKGGTYCVALRDLFYFQMSLPEYLLNFTLNKKGCHRQK